MEDKVYIYSLGSPIANYYVLIPKTDGLAENKEIEEYYSFHLHSLPIISSNVPQKWSAHRRVISKAEAEAMIKENEGKLLSGEIFDKIWEIFKLSDKR